MQAKPQSSLVRKLQTAARASKGVLPAHLPPILYLSDPHRGADPCSVAKHMLRGWGLIYRHFGASDRQSVAKQLAETARRRGLILLIAADPQLARGAGAHGVHWPEAGAEEALKWRGTFNLMTASAHSRSGAERLSAFGIDAVIRSAVFTSASPGSGHPIGAPAFRREAKRARLPYYGLGGLNAHNAHEIASQGGLAAITGIEKALGL